MLIFFCRFRFLIPYLLYGSGFSMCVAYIFTKLWTGKFFGLLARSSYSEYVSYTHSETTFMWQVGYKEAESAKKINIKCSRYCELAVTPLQI